MLADYSRRFGGVSRLYGEQGAAKLRAANVCVVGIGGVGSWAMEALARTGVGQITAVDLDMVAESNTNRQIHALGNVYGRAKVDAMHERVLEINPNCVVKCIEEFVTQENLKEIIHDGFDVVIDAIDQVKIKAAMIAHCHRQNTKIIVSGAAGGQTDPTQIRVLDISQTVQDPLLAKVRSILRREYGFSRGGKGKFGVDAVFSMEHLRYPDNTNACDSARGPTGLNCAGFGSSVCVTSVFGMTAASYAIQHIIERI